MKFKPLINRTLTFILTLCYLSNCFGQNSEFKKTLYIQNPGASDFEFEAFILNQSGGQSFSDFLIDKSLEREEKSKLFNLLKKAHLHYLNGEKNDSIEYFTKIIQLSNENDWSLSQRKIIHQSFLRLAQLSNTDVERKHWIQQAIFFDEDILPDNEIFSPHFVSQYNEIKQSELKNAFLWDVSLLKNSIESIRINGRRFKLKNGLHIKILGPNKYRITFLSNKYFPITMMLDKVSIQNLSLNFETIANGSCEQPDLNSKFAQEYQLTPAIYYSKSCIQKVSNGSANKIHSLEILNENYALSKKDEGSKNHSLTDQSSFETFKEQSVTSKSNTLNWIVGGAIGTAVLGAIFYFATQNKNEVERRPTHE